MEDLSFSFNLPHTQFAHQLLGIQTEPFQCEGAVQVPLTSTPDVVKGNFLQDERKKVELGEMWDQGIDAARPETAGSVLM